MKTLLIETLEKLGYPVYLQGTMPEDEEYPASFITFFTNDSEDAAHFDNEPVGVAWQYQVIFYSSDPRLVTTVPRDIRVNMRRAGFIPQGYGRDILSDEPTHTGWAMEFYYLEV